LANGVIFIVESDRNSFSGAMMIRLGKNSLLLAVILVIARGAHASDICDSQCQCLDVDSDSVVVTCKSYKGHMPDIDFEMIEWPKTEQRNRTIQAFFNNMSIHLLPK